MSKSDAACLMIKRYSIIVYMQVSMVFFFLVKNFVKKVIQLNIRSLILASASKYFLLSFTEFIESFQISYSYF